VAGIEVDEEAESSEEVESGASLSATAVPSSPLDDRAERSFVTIAFDGVRPTFDDDAIWEHFFVDGPFRESSRPPDRRRTSE